MTSLSMSSKKENWQDYYIWLEAIFYFFQGFYSTGLTVYTGVIMAQWELALTIQATVMAVSAIPSYLKMFTGLLSDRIPVRNWGRRKPYIILGALLYLPAFALLLSIRQFNALWIVAIGLASAAWVLVDGTLDALTVDVTPDEKAGSMQGAAIGARAVGMGLGAFLIPVLGPKIGWTFILVLIGIFAFAQALTVMFFRELPITKKELDETMPVKKVFRSVFGRPQSWLAIAFVFFAMAPNAIRTVMSSHLLTVEGWSKSETLMQAYAFVTLAIFGGTFLGSLITGRLFSKHHNQFSFFVYATLAAWVMLLSWNLLLILPVKPLLVIIIGIISGFGLGIITTSTYSIVMQVCPSSIEGFMFATLTSFMNLGLTAAAPTLITRLGKVMGSVIPALNVISIFSLFGLVFLFFILKAINNETETVAAPVQV